MRSLKKKFENWYMTIHSSPKYQTYNDKLKMYHPIKEYHEKKHWIKQIKFKGYKLSDYWWTETYDAFEAFKAGYELAKSEMNQSQNVSKSA